MPAPIPNEIRRQIVERHEDGEALTTISKGLNQSYNTVRKIWSHWRQVVSDEMKRQHPKRGHN